MASAAHMKPRLSVIVPAINGYDTALAALDAWEGQTRRSEIEIVVMCPTAPPDAGQLNQVFVETDTRLLHVARAMAIRVARADYVLLAEDHCLPDLDCAAALIPRFDEGWAAIGPALRPAVPGAIAQGSFLLGYGEWMTPVAGAAQHLPGHNAAVRRQSLLNLGDDLEGELLVSQFLIQRLKAEGGALLIEDRARMRHFDLPDFRRTIEIFFFVGQGCGAVRLKNASRVARVLYAALTPLIAARHFGRGLIQYARTGRKTLSLSSVPIGGMLACAWAFGESVGSLRGVDRVTPGLGLTEIKPVSREQVRRCRQSNENLPSYAWRVSAATNRAPQPSVVT